LHKIFGFALITPILNDLISIKVVSIICFIITLVIIVVILIYL